MDEWQVDVCSPCTDSGVGPPIPTHHKAFNQKIVHNCDWEAWLIDSGLQQFMVTAINDIDANGCQLSTSFPPDTLV